MKKILCFSSLSAFNKDSERYLKTKLWISYSTSVCSIYILRLVVTQCMLLFQNK